MPDPSIEEITPKIIRRFNDKVFKTEDCWIWRAAKDPNGYGRFGIGYKVYLSHRIAYLIAYKEIDSNLDVCHDCDYPPCCNPDHLFQGTRLENMQDCVSKDRQNYGIKHYAALFQDQDILDIREAYREPRSMSQRDLAKAYNVSRRTIENILNYQNWKHLP